MSSLTGLQFPPLPPAAGGALPRVSGADAVAQAIRTLLHTEPGERVGRPGFGVGLRRFLFAPDTLGTRAAIRHAIHESLRLHEPRAVVQEILVNSDSLIPGRLNIEIQYLLAGDPTPRAVQSAFTLDDTRG